MSRYVRFMSGDVRFVSGFVTDKTLGTVGNILLRLLSYADPPTLSSFVDPPLLSSFVPPTIVGVGTTADDELWRAMKVLKKAQGTIGNNTFFDKIPTFWK